jgi:hypothetical protein
VSYPFLPPADGADSIIPAVVGGLCIHWKSTAARLAQNARQIQEPWYSLRCSSIRDASAVREVFPSHTLAAWRSIGAEQISQLLLRPGGLQHSTAGFSRGALRGAGAGRDQKVGGGIAADTVKPGTTPTNENLTALGSAMGCGTASVGRGVCPRPSEERNNPAAPATLMLAMCAIGRAEECQRESIARAKAQHRYKGRVPTARRQSAEIIRLKDAGVRPSEIASRLEIGRVTARGRC